jgi:hypothetical protein
MKRLLNRRPSAGVIIGLLALVLAVGGGAYAAKKTKKVPYKGLDKDARLKVLPVSKTNANTTADPTIPGPPCDPTSTTFTDCTSVSVTGSSAFPRKYMLVFDGTFSATGAVARGDCRLEADNQPIRGATIKVEAVGPSTANHGSGSGINIVTTPLGGQHTFSVACNETGGTDLKVEQFQLSAITVR